MVQGYEELIVGEQAGILRILASHRKLENLPEMPRCLIQGGAGGHRPQRAGRQSQTYQDFQGRPLYLYRE